MAVVIQAIDRPDVPIQRMSDRFRHEINYFMTPAGAPGVPALQAGEYWIRQCDTAEYLDEGVVRIVSPLDSNTKAELELTEEQEIWLEWMHKYKVEHVKLTSDFH